jgi:hypothetical protein
MKNIIRLLPACVLLAVLAAGCAFTVAQSPETVAPGRIFAGGLASVSPGYKYTTPKLLWPYSTEVGVYGRAGLARNFDAGLRVSLPGGIAADAKYQLLSQRAKLAVGLGASYVPFIKTSLISGYVPRSQVGVYPLVVGGSRQLYGGVRGVGMLVFTNDYQHRDLYAGPEFFAGSSIGRGRLQVLPEVHAWWLPYAPEPALGIGAGIAVQYQLKGSLAQYEKLIPKGLIPGIN